MSTNHSLFDEKGEPKRYRTEVLPDSARTDRFKLKREKEQQCTEVLSLPTLSVNLNLKPSRDLYDPVPLVGLAFMGLCKVLQDV